MPIQQGVILTQARVRVPSIIGLFVMHTAAGMLGAAGAAAGSLALKNTTRLSPGYRASLTLAAGLLGGALVGRSSPRIGAGVTLGSMAAAVPDAVEALQTAAAMRELPAAPVTSLGTAPVVRVISPSGSAEMQYAPSCFLSEI